MSELQRSEVSVSSLSQSGFCEVHISVLSFRAPCITLTAQLMQEAGRDCMCSPWRPPMCSGNTLQNRHPLLTSKQSCFVVLCLSCTWKGSPGLALMPRDLYFVYFHFSEPKATRMELLAAVAIFWDSSGDNSVTWTSERTTRTYTTSQTPFYAYLTSVSKNDYKLD